MTAASPKHEVVAPPIQMGHAEAAIFETLVVPRYLSCFGDPVVALLAEGSDARVVHLDCRTGYPDQALLARLPNVHVHGCDRSENAIQLARVKAAALVKGKGAVKFDYRVVGKLPLPFPDGAFSHALTLHPLVTREQRRELLSEIGRLVASRGQALVALPLHGSFIEVADLLREYALKHERSDLISAVDRAADERATPEVLKAELEVAGFEYVEVDVHRHRFGFPNGRAFLEDPLTRLVLMAELHLGLSLEAKEAGGAPDPFAYVREAIDKYWSDGSFELSVNVGVLSGRRRR